MSCNQFWSERLLITQALIIEIEAAMLGLSTGAIQSYTLDTGQTKQTVTKANVTELRNFYDGLLNRLVTIQARLGCGGSTYARPVF